MVGGRSRYRLIGFGTISWRPNLPSVEVGSIEQREDIAAAYRTFCEHSDRLRKRPETAQNFCSSLQKTDNALSVEVGFC